MSKLSPTSLRNFVASTPDCFKLSSIASNFISSGTKIRTLPVSVLTMSETSAMRWDWKRSPSSSSGTVARAWVIVSGTAICQLSSFLPSPFTSLAPLATAISSLMRAPYWTRVGSLRLAASRLFVHFFWRMRRSEVRTLLELAVAEAHTICTGLFRYRSRTTVKMKSITLSAGPYLPFMSRGFLPGGIAGKRESHSSRTSVFRLLPKKYPRVSMNFFDCHCRAISSDRIRPGVVTRTAVSCRMESQRPLRERRTSQASSRGT
mmetsp:Transcript_27741/g.82732  ORF Transcript_27741/g.82732 Transcript_27741/m.82732 type:complete len:262 (-) Transcript_27741:892-1677(-)